MKARWMPQNNQSGNVFIIILLGVFLFGALLYSFSKSANQGTGNLSKQQAKVAAQEILSYARLVEGAVDRVRRNGCSETQISFENAVVSGYSNPNAPADKSCHIFNDAGGQLAYAEIPKNYLDTSFSSYQSNLSTTWGEWLFGGRNTIPRVGTTCATQDCKELLASIHFIQKDICFEINKLLNIPHISGDAPPERTSSPPGGIATLKFTGLYTNSANGVDAGVSGANSACLKVSVSGKNYYFFYHVLIAR